MRTAYILILMFFGLAASAQTPTLDSLSREAKLSDGDISMNIPGCLMRFGLSMMDVEETHGIALKTLKKGLRKARIVVFEDLRLPVATSKRIQSEFRNDGYEEYVSVRDGGTHVNIMLREKCDKITNLVILVNEPEAEFVAITLKTKLKVEDLQDLIASIN